MRIHLGFGLVLGAIAGCSGAKPEPAKPPTPDYARLQSEAVVKVIEEGIRTDEWREFDKACDLEEFTRRVIGSTVVSYEVRMLLRAMVQGDSDIVPGFTTPPHNLIRNLLMMGNKVRFLRIRNDQGTPKPLYRILTPQGGVNYCEWILAPDRSAKPRIVDAYSFAHGELVSIHQRRTVLPRPDQLQVINSLKIPTPMDLFGVLPERYELIERNAEGRFAEALKIFEEHRRTLEGDRTAHTARMTAAAGVGGEAMIGAFEEFEAKFPGDPSLLMLRPRYHQSSGRLDQALEALEAVDRAVEGDRFLDVLRSWIHLEAGRLARAEELAKGFTNAEPDIAEGWYARIAVRLREQDVAGALKLLREGDKAATLVLARVKALPGIESLFSSPEFKAWKDMK